MKLWDDIGMVERMDVASLLFVFMEIILNGDKDNEFIYFKGLLSDSRLFFGVVS